MTVATETIAWARGRMGQTVGAGECWDLVNSALIAGGAHGSEHFGTIGENVDYIWGTPVALNAVRAGDLLQTRDHVVTTTTLTTTRYSDGEVGTSTDTVSEDRPHHSAIVTSLLDRNGTFETIEQNVEPDGRVVQVKRFSSRNVATVTTTRPGRAVDPRTNVEGPVTITTAVTLTVSGTIRAFRPVAR